jgi:hypothetical protein
VGHKELKGEGCAGTGGLIGGVVKSCLTSTGLTPSPTEPSFTSIRVLLELAVLPEPPPHLRTAPPRGGGNPLKSAGIREKNKKTKL